MSPLENTPLGEQLFELIHRIDERVQIMMKKQDDLERKIDEQINQVNDINIRVRLLESSKTEDSLKLEIERLKDDFHEIELKFQKIENTALSSESKLKSIFGFGIQIVWVLLAAYLLYKLGLQAPP